MTLANFITSLFDSGAVEVPPIAPWDEAELQAARDALVGGERIYRDSLAEGTPALEIEAALWGAQQFYRAAQRLTFRNNAAAAPQQGPAERPPTDNGPAVQYSVDVMMRFLPDLIRHASAVPREDPLMATLYGWAADWPLSSVGVPLDRPVDDDAVASIVSDRSLLIMYIDRIVARKDLSRLSHPSVIEAIRAAIGIHADLAPEIQAALPAGTISWPVDENSPSQGDTP